MQIDFTKQFIKQYNKQSGKIQDRFNARLKLFEQDQNKPILNVHALSGKYQGYSSINITGDIRAIFKRQGDTIIIFAFIGSHSQLYG